MRETMSTTRPFKSEFAREQYLATQSFSPRKMVPPLPLTDAQWAKYQSKTLFLAGDREVLSPSRSVGEARPRGAPGRGCLVARCGP